MSAPDGRAPARRRLLAAAVVVLCALPATAPPASATSGPATERVLEAERQVEEAEQRLRDAADRAAEVTERLDTAAGRYEHALAHRLRLEEEADDLAGRATVATARALDAEEVFARQVASNYMRPGSELALAGAIVLAPDPHTAIHRASLLERIALRERQRADRAHDEAALAGDVNRQHQVVRAGVHVAAEDSRRTAEDLQLQLTTASHQVAQARESLTGAEADLDRVIAEEERRLEEERRAEAARRAAEEAARRAAELAATGSGPLPPVDGKVCPIGAPNAFIDSWGFPRSGGRRHKGVDMFAEYGMPLYAVGDGVIRRVWNNRLGGLSIDLIDTDGHRYYYAHLSAVSVQAGQRVRAGEVIGANGNSGNARTTPPHLHWQYHPGDGPPVNPYPLARSLCR